MKEFTVQRADTLKNFTDNTYPQGSFYFSSLLKKRDIRVNGVKVSSNILLNPNDKVSYYTTATQENKSAFYTVFEDDNVLIIDKESGVNSEAVFSALVHTEKEYYFIHRLDRNTKGLMIFAKNKKTEAELLAAFKERKIDKIYNAICVGKFKKDKDVLMAYLKKSSQNSMVSLCSEPNGGVKIVTEYRILKRTGNLNYVEITLHTGKTHQIRAHMAHIGCPVLGDTKYGNRKENERYKLTRQCLIAKRLRLHTNGILAYLNGKEFISAFDLHVGE